MVTTSESSKIEVNEYISIIEEFKQRLLNSMQRDQDKIIELADNEAKLILKKAYQESAGLVAEAREKIKEIIGQAREQANRETEATLSRAREQADHIIQNAEQTIRKEAKEKTRLEMDSILSQAKQNAATITNDTLKVAREAGNKLVTEAKEHALFISQNILDEAKKESEDIIRTSQELKEKATVELAQAQKKTTEIIDQINFEVREAAVEKAEKQAAEILAKAKVESQNERDSLIASSTAEAIKAAESEKTQIIQQAQQEARQIIDTARMDVLAKIFESNRLMQEIQEKMQQVIDTSVPEILQAPASKNSPTPLTESTVAPEPVTQKIEKKVKTGSRTKSVSGKNKSESQQVVNQIESVSTNDSQTYCGKLKIEVAAPVDRGNIAMLEEQLSQFPNIRVIMNGGTERGTAWIMVELTEQIDVLDILKKIPIIKNVENANGFVKITMNGSHLNI